MSAARRQIMGTKREKKGHNFHLFLNIGCFCVSRGVLHTRAATSFIYEKKGQKKKKRCSKGNQKKKKRPEQMMIMEDDEPRGSRNRILRSRGIRKACIGGEDDG